MTPEQLRAPAKKFALDVLRLAKAVPQDPINNEIAICADSMTRPLWKDADELTRILVRSRETCRANRQSPIKNQSITNR